MDPNATLALIADLLRRSASDESAGEALDVACQDLFDWLSHGGFAPSNKDDHPSAWGYYQVRARGNRV
jgi:hypothetical protein